MSASAARRRASGAVLGWVSGGTGLGTSRGQNDESARRAEHAFPFRPLLRRRNRNELPPIVVAAEPARRLEAAERVTEGLVADAELGA